MFRLLEVVKGKAAELQRHSNDKKVRKRPENLFLENRASLFNTSKDIRLRYIIIITFLLVCSGLNLVQGAEKKKKRESLESNNFKALINNELEKSGNV